MLRIIFICIMLSIICLAPWGTAKEVKNNKQSEGLTYKKAEQIGSIASPKIQEASGLAVSLQKRDILWVINDSGNPPELYAINYSGQLRAIFRIDQVENRDWEDLAAFYLNGQAFLLIADVGDNWGKRSFCYLYLVKEPELKNKSGKTIKRLNVERKIKFQYSDGPKDCEAVAVDARGKRVFLVSKRTSPPILYSLPLGDKQRSGRYTARRVTKISTISKPKQGDLEFTYGQNFSQPTAMDISADGKQLVILTYKDAYCYRKKAQDKWKMAFAKTPLRIPLPHPASGILRQREALAIDKPHGNLLVTTEGINGQIFCIRNYLQENNGTSLNN